MLICFGARVSIIHSVVSNCGSLFTSGADEYFQFNPMLIVAGAVFTDMDTRASLCGGQFPPSPSSSPSPSPCRRVQRSVSEVVLEIGSTTVSEQKSTALVVPSLGFGDFYILSSLTIRARKHLAAEVERSEPSSVLHVQVCPLLAKQLQGETVAGPGGSVGSCVALALVLVVNCGPGLVGFG